MSVSFFLFPCSKEQAIRAYLDTIKNNFLYILQYSFSEQRFCSQLSPSALFRLLFLSIFCLVFTFTYKYMAMAASYKSNKVMGLSTTFTFIASNIALPPVYIPSPTLRGFWWYENSVFGPLGQPGQY